MLNFAHVVQSVQNRTHKLFRLHSRTSEEREHEKKREEKKTEKEQPQPSTSARVPVILVQQFEEPQSHAPRKVQRKISNTTKPLPIRIRRQSSRVACASLDRRPLPIEQKRSTISVDSRRQKTTVVNKPTTKKVTRKMNKIVIKGPAVTPRLRYTMEKQAELQKKREVNKRMGGF